MTHQQENISLPSFTAERSLDLARALIGLIDGTITNPNFTAASVNYVSIGLSVLSDVIG